MRVQTTAVLLSALLCTTFAHEWLQHPNALHHQARHHHENQHHLQNRVVSSPSGGEICYWQCPTQPSSNNQTTINIYFNETTNIIAFINATAQVALVVDINAQIVAAIQGDGAAIVFDVVKQVGVYITASQSSSLTWHSSTETIEVFLSKLVTLKTLLDAENCHHFTLTTITTEELQIIFKVLINLSVELRGSLKAADSLKILLQLSQTLIKILTNDIIKQLLTTLTNGVIHIGGDLTQLISILQAIINLFGSISGGISGLIKAGVIFNFGIILESGSGLQVLINILLQIGEKVDIGKLLGSLLSTPEALFKLLAQFSGGKSYGVDGVSVVIYNLILLINKKIEIDVFFQILVSFSVSAKGSISYTLELNGFSEIIRIQQQRYGNSSLTDLSVVITKIVQGTFTIGGLKISSIIEILVAGIKDTSNGALEIVISVILAITSVVSASTSVPKFVFYLLTSLNTTVGIQVVGQLVPSLNITATSSVELFASIFKNVNILTIWLQGIWKGLLSIPVVGDILKAVATVLKSLSNGTLDLEALLTGNISIVAEIKKFIEWAVQLVIKGGTSVTGTTQSGSWSWSIGFGK